MLFPILANKETESLFSLVWVIVINKKGRKSSLFTLSLYVPQACSASTTVGIGKEKSRAIVCLAAVENLLTR